MTNVDTIGTLPVPRARLAFLASLACTLGCVALSSGCASQGSREEPPLPFHVAVVPLSAESVKNGTSATESTEEGLRLSLDAAQVSREVAANLNGACFTRATLLPYPEGLEPAVFEKRPTAERNAYWVKAAEAAGADLVFECDLRFSPAVESGHNEKFWMNLPLFLLGGPACYFVDDVSYHGDARLDGNFLDLNAVRARLATLDDGRAQLLHVESRFQEATLDFLDRAGGNVGLYGASILVPAGLLSHESSNAEKQLSEEVASDLARGLARAVHDGANEILIASRLAGFHLDPEYKLEIQEGIVHFRGVAILRRGDRERMETYSARVGARAVSGEFGDGEPDRANSTRRTQYVRFPFRIDIPSEPGANQLSIQLTAGGPNPGVRTFTILIPDRKSETSASLAASP